MLGELSHVEKIYIRCGYTDMRKQLNGLLDIIQYNFKLDPYSNSLFLFCGKRADRIKAVHYEGDGFCLLYLSLIHISEPTRQAEISYAVFCLKKKKQTRQGMKSYAAFCLKKKTN